MLIEFNPTAIFAENKGRAFSEWSYRELQLHMGYLNMKNRIEGIEDKEQARINQAMFDDK